MELPRRARIFIIEGIPGSGKSTLRTQLQAEFKHRDIEVYCEEALLQSFQHQFIPNVGRLRLQLYNRLLDTIERKLRDKPDYTFLLERFHLTTYANQWKKTTAFERDYKKLIERLRKLPVHVLLLTLDAHDIETRLRHPNRDEEWLTFLEKRREMLGFKNNAKMYLAQQTEFLKLVKEQGITFTILESE